MRPEADTPRPPRGSTTGQRRALRRSQTDAERRLWYLLRARQPGALKFRRQHAVGPYVLDFYSFEAHLAVELDGSPHGEPEGVARDERRTRYLVQQGIRVLRFSDGDVLRMPESVVEAILVAVSAEGGSRTLT